MTVLATREGLRGHTTASGYVIDNIVPFVALPSRKALGRFVRIVNPANTKSCFAVCLEIGPWDIADEAYVFGDARPRAESGTDQFGRRTNGAGIDLGERVWHELGMTDNSLVDWHFIDA